MRKKCLSCGAQFALSGSGKRQKYCQECSRRGDGRVRGLPASNSLKVKAAKQADLGTYTHAQIEAQKDQPNSITFTTPDGYKGRVWLASDEYGQKIIGDDRWWRVNILEAIKLASGAAKERDAKRSKISSPIHLMGPVGSRKTIHGRLARGRTDLRQAIFDTELAPPLKGFRVVLCFQDEAPAIGSGQRLVLCQFRGKKVILHGGGYTATIKRDVFKALVASNKKYRKRNRVETPARPQLKLVVSNPPRNTIKEEAA